MVYRQGNFVLAVNLLLISMLIFRELECRDIRPSDHGLSYQNNPTGVKSPEMMSFFKGSAESPAMGMPEARNSSENPWWLSPGKFGGKEGHGHVKEVLLVASLVCGVVGVSLLVAAALFYYFRFRKSSPK